MEVGATIPGMELLESSQEQRPRQHREARSLPLGYELSSKNRRSIWMCHQEYTPTFPSFPEFGAYPRTPPGINSGGGRESILEGSNVFN